ncbi:MAG: hypothetical protein K8W52_22125 [Deltaproteobacteria bacterium]|nr:hypothetical protein [Deltaproteobacteria bacterium]
MTDPSTQDPTIETDTNQGEGNVAAAIAYNDAATAFASEPELVAEAAQAAVAAEPGPFVAFASTDAGEVAAVDADAAVADAADADGATAIEVTFDGAGWRIHDPASPNEPVFLKLQDAEQRAATLARASGRGVCIRDQGGDVVAQYAAAPPQ